MVPEIWTFKVLLLRRVYVPVRNMLFEAQLHKNKDTARLYNIKNVIKVYCQTKKQTYMDAIFPCAEMAASQFQQKA